MSPREPPDTDFTQSPGDCQSPTALAGGVDPGIGDLARQWTRRLRRAAQRRISRYFSILGRWRGRTASDSEPAKQSKSSSDFSKPRGQAFHAGEVVEVLPYEEILDTLDANRRCEGLEFMEGMRPFCGRRMVVLKRVRLIFDEQLRKMLAVKRERYVLEGAICNGGGLYSREGCDRCCFYFWCRQWLRRPS